MEVGERLQVAMRLMKTAVREVFAPEPVIGLGAAGGTVWCLAAVEATMITRRPARSFRFIRKYATAQLLPSIIWLTKPASTVATSLGMDASTLLRSFVNDATKSPHAAGRALRVQTVQTARQVFAGFVGIAQILRLFDIASETRSMYHDAVLAAQEPLLSGVKGRVVRLAGQQSDVTALSMEEDGAHIVPVFENPALCRELLRTHSLQGTRPVGWHVPSDSYGKRESWVDFNVSSEWLFPVQAGHGGGHGVLFVEADASVGEQALSLGRESSNDLTLQEASQGFRSIERLARARGVLGSGDAVVRVLLADASLVLRSGGGEEYTLGQQVHEGDHSDILIDAKKPLVCAVLAWARDATAKINNNNNSHSSSSSSSSSSSHTHQEDGSGSGGELIFDTDNAEYFATLQDTLAPHGWHVLDRIAARRGRSEAEYARLPRLVYHEQTTDTVNTIVSLKRQQQAHQSAVCALLDSHHGLQELDGVYQDAMLNETVQTICSARVYHDLFAHVRGRVLQGTPLEEVQRELDGDMQRLVASFRGKK